MIEFWTPSFFVFCDASMFLGYGPAHRIGIGIQLQQIGIIWPAELAFGTNLAPVLAFCLTYWLIWPAELAFSTILALS